MHSKFLVLQINKVFFLNKNVESYPETHVWLNNESHDRFEGLHIGDELVVLNNLMVSELDMVYIETTLEECESVSLTVRSSRSVDQLRDIEKKNVEEMGCLPAPSTHLWQRIDINGKS